jgi:DNA-binding transcriptional MerR regulator
MAGVSASTIGFYKKAGLLPASFGAGRGANYGEVHVERLRKIGEYRQLGYSLAAMRAIFEGTVDILPTGKELDAAGVPEGRDMRVVERADSRSPLFSEPNTTLTNVATVFGRVKLFEGLELHYEVGRYVVNAQRVEELREAMRAILCAGWEE